MTGWRMAAAAVAAALGLHLAAFAALAPSGRPGGAGAGGQDLVTLAPADPALAALVADWDRPPQTAAAAPAPRPADADARPPAPPAAPAVARGPAPAPLAAPRDEAPPPAAPAPLPRPAPVAAPEAPAAAPPPEPPPDPPHPRAPEPGPDRPAAPRPPAPTAPEAPPRAPVAAPTAPEAPARAPDRAPATAPVARPPSRPPSLPATAAAGQGGAAVAGDRGRAGADPARMDQADLAAGWGATIRARVERRKTYPPAARGAQGTVVLRLTVARDGRLIAADVAHGSGHGALDAAALEAARRAGRFPAAPAALTGTQFRFDLPMTFAR